MRLVALLCVLAAPLSAETLLTGSKITSVTVYPQGAEVTRLVTFDAAPGAHDLRVTDLPRATDPQTLRLRPMDGVQIGAYVLRSGRVAPQDAVKQDVQLAAEAALDAATDAVTRAQITLDGVTARMDAAQAQITYLSRLGATDAKQETATLQATSRMIAAEVLTANQAILAARLDVPTANRALETATQAQTKAQAVLDAVTPTGTDNATLSLAIVTSTDGPHQLMMTQFVDNAAWSPLYDAALDRGAGQVTLDRSLLVSQSTGEDWAGVALTLSTAQPNDRAEPSGLWPPLHRIDDPIPESAKMDDRDGGAGFMVEPMFESAIVVQPSMMGVQFQGDIVSYAYPVLVDIADGVENLRLALDRVTLPATVQARAVPRYDATAFVMAELANDSGEVMLPGPVFLTRDGAFVGLAELATLAPGATAMLGFGAVEGLRLKRVVPARAEGDRGLFSKSNQIEETAVLSVENLTAESWDIRVMDMVPYSEQEDLVITYTASPPVTDMDVEGRRGLLAWDWTLGAGDKMEVTLSTRQSWPEGKELNGGGRY